MGTRVYVFDTNVLINAKRDYYAFDLVPEFWSCLIRHADAGRVKSIDRIKRELERGSPDHELLVWVNNHFLHAFQRTDETDIIAAYGVLMKWSRNQKQFFDAAKAEFAQKADAWLVAYAMAKRCVLVTHEVFEPNIKRKIKIPNACQPFGVPYVKTFEMLRDLGGIDEQVAVTSTKLLNKRGNGHGC